MGMRRWEEMRVERDGMGWSGLEIAVMWMGVDSCVACSGQRLVVCAGEHWWRWFDAVRRVVAHTRYVRHCCSDVSTANGV